MWLLRLAWLNLWRNRNRTLISMAAVFFAVLLSTVLSSISDGAFDNMVKNVVRYYTGYIQIHRKGYWNDQTLENSFAWKRQSDSTICASPGVLELVPRLESFSLAAAGDVTRSVLVVGTDLEKEDKVTGLKSKLISGNLTDADSGGVLLCDGLAGRLKLSVGDTLLLIGQGYHGSTAAGKYVVKGLLHYGSPDLNDRMLFMSLADARLLFSADEMITSYVLLLDESAQLSVTAESLSNSLAENYEVMTWEEIMPELKQHIETDTRNSRIFLSFLYVLVSMGIFGTMLMLMIERSYELGMLLAIGMKKYKMMMLLVMESVLTVMAGCIAGMICSVPLIYYLNIHPIRLSGELQKTYERFGFEAILPSSTEPEHFFRQALTVFFIGIVLSLYPIWKVMKLDPVNSMKR